MGRLSLCLIARNEEAMLGGCLESVKGVVDEIVLVDTGSTDATIEIARRFGAKIIEQPWADDFATPRNTALRAATGEWVLQLDADERLGPDAGRALKKFVHTKPKIDAALLALHNASGLSAEFREVISGKKRLGSAAWLPRLLRHSAGLVYEGVIHETVLESLARSGMKVARIDGIDIVHLGAIPEFRASRGKNERNVEMLKKRCALEPDNVVPFGYLALELVHAGRVEEALPVIARGFALVGTQPKYRSAIRLAVAKGLVLLSENQGAAVIEMCELVEKHEGEHPDLNFLKGCGHELMAYEMRRGTRPRPTDSRISGNGDDSGDSVMRGGDSGSNATMSGNDVDSGPIATMSRNGGDSGIKCDHVRERR